MRVEKSYIVVLAAAATMLGGFGLGVWLPENRRAEAMRNRIATAEEKLGPNFNQPTALIERQERLASMREQLASHDRQIPVGDDLASLLRSLAQAIADQGLDKQEVKTGDARHHRHFSEVPVELDLEGDFESIYALLDDIESMPRLTRIDALNLRVQPDTQERALASPSIRASLRLVSFFTPEPEPQP